MIEWPRLGQHPTHELCPISQDYYIAPEPSWFLERLTLCSKSCEFGSGATKIGLEMISGLAATINDSTAGESIGICERKRTFDGSFP